MFTEISVGAESRRGSSVSIIVTVKIAVPTFPLSSVASQVIVFSPIGNCCPSKVPKLNSFTRVVTIPQLSEAVTSSNSVP